MEEQNDIYKKFEELQWYHGELKAQKEAIENALRNSERRCDELQSEIDQMRLEFGSVQDELSKTKWYLGEAQAATNRN